MSQSRNAYRAERPLTARSLVASTLLGTHPPVLPGRVLVRLGELFGIAEGTTRVALSRMVAAGELEAEDGRYRLVGAALLARQAAQERGRVVPRKKWQGEWVMAVILADRRDAPERAALRTSAMTLGLAELRQGVWMRPDNFEWSRQIGTATGDAYAVVDAQCAWMTVVRTGDGSDLARQLWDLDSWANAATGLIADMRRTRLSLDRGGFDAIPRAFVTSAAVLRLFRADPLLPGALLPASWPGDGLRTTYRDYDVALRALLRAFFMPTPDPPSAPGGHARTRSRPGPRSAGA
jgi:phenylacetic acid degradation operon negative regulatory protein